MEIIGPLVDGAKRSLLSAGVLEENISLHTVPGSYELPYAAQRLVNDMESQLPIVTVSCLNAVLLGYMPPLRSKLLGAQLLLRQLVPRICFLHRMQTSASSLHIRLMCPSHSMPL